MSRVVWWAPIGLSLMLAGAAGAIPAVIANPGFEDLYLGSNLPAQYGGDVPTGAFPTGPPPAGWTPYYELGVPPTGAFLGVLNPGTQADYGTDPACFPAGAPEGDNVALLFTSGDAGGDEYGIEQTLGETVQPYTRYTLTVEVGDIATCAGLVAPYLNEFTLDGFPGYRVELLAGGVLLESETNVLMPGDGNFATASFTFTTGAAPLQEDLPLTIRLVNRNEPDVPGVEGLEVDFDDVRLEITSALPLPVGSAAPWLLTLLLAGLGGRFGRVGSRSDRDG